MLSFVNVDTNETREGLIGWVIDSLRNHDIITQ